MVDLGPCLELSTLLSLLRTAEMPVNMFVDFFSDLVRSNTDQRGSWAAWINASKESNRIASRGGETMDWIVWW